MFVMKIRAGNWEDGTLGLSEMPKSFILSARKVVVLEVDEYEKLKEAAPALREACKIALPALKNAALFMHADNNLEEDGLKCAKAAGIVENAIEKAES